MKLYLGSDLHLEFGPLTVENKHNADVLVLSGDICVAKDIRNVNPQEQMPARARLYYDFFQDCSDHFKDVIYVMGNHEHYNGDFPETVKILREFLKDFNNIHILERDVKRIGDVTFIGGTLWTDMNKEDPMTIHAIRDMMNDFRLVTNSTTPVHYRDSDGNFQTRTAKFSPGDAVEEHKKTLQYIQTVIEGKFEDKFVVVGHHAPSKLSTKPRYQNDVLMNGGYSSDLSEFILDHPQIKVWTHGHTHDKFDYMIGSTRVVCNPRGYVGYEDEAYFFKFQLIEV